MTKKPVFFQKAGFFALGFLTLLGLTLRVVRLEFQPLWWDEGYSVWFATHPVGQMAALTAQDIHPPLYYALLRGWTILLGTAPVVLRLFSAVVGALAIPAIYLAGRRLLAPQPAGLTPRAAWLAALLLAINPLHIYYSQEVRMYGLVALWSIGAVAAAWVMLGSGRAGGQGSKGAEEQRGRGAGEQRSRGAEEQRSRGAGEGRLVTWSRLAYILLTTAALYTQYYAAFLPVGLTIYALWQWWQCRKAGRGATAGENVIARSVLGDEAISFNVGDCFGPNSGPRNDAPEAIFRTVAHVAPAATADETPHVPGTSEVPGTWGAIFRTVFHAAPAATADEKRSGLEALAGLVVNGRNRLKPRIRSGGRRIFRTVAHAAAGATAHENVMLSGSTSQGPLRRESSEASPSRIRDSSLVSRRDALCASDPLRVTSGGSIFRTVHPCDAALLRWLAAQVAVAVLYLPWLLYAAPKLIPYVSQKVVQDADRPLGLLIYLARHMAAFLAGHLEGSLSSYWPVALALLLPLALGWWLLITQGRGDAGKRSQNVTLSPCHPSTSSGQALVTLSPFDKLRASSGRLLAITLITTLLLGWAVGLRYPFFPERGERLLLLALPPFLLLAAAGLDALWTRARVAGYVALGLIGALAGASLLGFYTVPRYPADDYRPLIARTVEQGLPEDTVFCVYPWQVGYWRSYGSPDGPSALLTPDATWSPAVSDALDAALARGRVWFPAHLALGAGLETRVEEYLAGRAVPFANEWYGPGTRLNAWATDAGTGQVVPIAPIRFTLPGAVQAVTLAGVAAMRGPVPAANAVAPLTLTWQADDPLPVLTVSARLVDDLGQIWAQHDYESANLSGLTHEDRLGLLIPAGTPPGRYNVEVAVRSKAEARPLEAIGADDRSLGPAARLFELTVAPADRTLGPERLPVAARRSVQLGDGLRFLGYSVAETPAVPGELRKVSLFWQATATPSTDYTAFLQLLDRQGRVAAGWEAPPGAAYPTSRWVPGTLIRTQASFRPPAALPDGRPLAGIFDYRLIAGLFRASDKERLEQSPALGLIAHGADHLTLGYVTVAGRPHTMTPPGPIYAADVRFGEVARLVGYDLAPAAQAEIAPGSALSLTLHWQAIGSTDRAYTVFVHLVDEAGATHGYGDSEPGAGQFPTTGWLPGEYLADRHEVTIVAGAPPGRYRLAVGLYDPATGQRLTTRTGTDQVVLDMPVWVSLK